MARNNDLIKKRNNNLKQRYYTLSERHPEWKYDAILGLLSKEYYITKRTVTSIINN